MPATPPIEPEYPEHARLLLIKHESQAQANLLEWLAEQGLCIAERVGADEELFAVTESMQAMLARYHEIDLTKLEKEKQAMLDNLRQANQQPAL